MSSSTQQTVPLNGHAEESVSSDGMGDIVEMQTISEGEDLEQQSQAGSQERDEDEEGSSAGSTDGILPFEEDNDEDDFKEPKKSLARRALLFGLLTMQSYGVVYGDLGTSPIYVYQTTYNEYGTSEPIEDDDVLGIQCLVAYLLIVIAMVKYCIFVMAADRNGDGGILSLVSLIPPDYMEDKKKRKQYPKFYSIIKMCCIVLSFVGAAFLIGDGGITPSISVLSAIEGLNVVW